MKKQNYRKMEKEKMDNKLNIELPEEVAEGIYSNLAVIAHSHSEFVIDFIKILPGVPKGKVKSRIILTPEHAKRLLKAISENIKRYEEQFGKIKDINPPAGPTIPINFGGQAQA